MAAGRRLFAFAPAWMWLFWLAAALVVAAGAGRGGEPQPRFLVSTGTALEVWHGAERERTLFRFNDGAAIQDDVAISPDGTEIAFMRFGVGGAGSDFGIDLYVVSRDGRNPRAVVKHTSEAEFRQTPVWLSSHEIAYYIFNATEGGGADRRIETVDLRTGAQRRLVEDADQPALMADGRRLIVRLADFRPGRSGETPVYVDVATGRQEDLPEYNLQLLFIGSFVQSPDGKQIAFGAADPNVRAPIGPATRGTSARALTHPILQDVWLMDVNGGNLHRIADLAVSSPSLAWSEDGRYVYAMSSIGFWRIHAKTGTHRKIGPGLANGRIKLLPATR